MFTDKTAWIWPANAPRRQNTFACFRRVFDVSGSAASAVVKITADARYELLVNGEWVGHGPPRSWPNPWTVDQYEIRHLLKSGRNVIAVLVQDIGVSTFQYLASEPGLVAQFSWADSSGEHQLATDAEWKAIVHDGFLWPVTRISCQEGWEEQFDARRAPGDSAWRQADFDDSAWPAAGVLRAAGQPPHDQFEPRDIPMMTRETVEPASIVAIEAVKPAPYTLSLNLRDRLTTEDLSANHICSRMLVGTFIHSDRAQAMEIHRPNGGRETSVKFNGAKLDWDDRSELKTDSGISHVRLKAGWNLLLCRMHNVTHVYYPAFNIWTAHPITFAARPDGSANPATPWLIIGPFEEPVIETTSWLYEAPLVRASKIHPEATAALIDVIWERGSLTDADLALPFAKPADPDMIHGANVFAQCASERLVKGAKLRVDDPSALQQDTSDWTTIHPTKGADVRLLLDFGKEVVGYHEFVVDAPEGTIIDDHNFEIIQRDGRFNLAEGMNNSFRYICREGTQHYRTFVRRGFRYSWITFRNFDRPVRVRFIRTLLSTYPIAQVGDFACSNAMVQEIWKVGVHSVRCCSEDTYTDCPTYEQTHWVGDARNEAMVDLIVNGDPRLSEHCWVQAARSMNRSPIVESHVPSGWQNLVPAWSFLWMRWAYGHYQLTGDKKFAARAMEDLDRNVRGVEQHINDRGLFEITAWNLFDWAGMDTPGRGVVTHNQCLAVLGLREAAELARLIKRDKLAKKWDKLGDELTDAVNKHLWDKSKHAYLDSIHLDGKNSEVFSQQTQTAAYISGVATGERAKRCREIIRKAPKGFIQAGSPFFMFFLLEGLVREGRWDELVKTIHDYWGPQIEAGATTFWEMYYRDQERKTRSHCHGWSAAPTFFLSSYVLGVQPAKPGFEEILIAPHPGDLKWAHGRVATPHGAVEVDWRYEGKAYHFRATLPKNTPVRLELPAKGKLVAKEGSFRKLTGPSGTTTLAAKGPTLACVIQG